MPLEPLHLRAVHELTAHERVLREARADRQRAHAASPAPSRPRSAETSADVLWDYVTLSPEADVRIRTNFAAFEREARAIFERCAGPDSYLRIKPTQICFDHLALDRAKRAALELYRLVETYLSARPVMREPEHTRPSLREAAASIA